MDDHIIRRQLLYRPGELFRRSDVRASLRRIYALELFEFANIELVNGDAGAPGQQGGDHTVPTRVTVTEGDHRRVEFSIGYGTEEKARVEAEWRHVNFYGGARTLGVHGKWSWLAPRIDLSSHPPMGGAEILSLVVFNQPLSLLGSGQQVSLAARAAALATGSWPRS